MRFRITDSCIKCGACALDCPVWAISHGGTKFVIGPKCIGCGDCYTICPVGAVEKVEEEDLPELERKGQ